MFESLFHWLSGLSSNDLFLVLLAFVIVAIFVCWMLASIFGSIFDAWGKRRKCNKKEES
jgi:hypothetical protein